MSIRWQIALALAAVAAVVGAGAGIGSYVATQRELQRTIDQSLSTVAARAADGFGPGGPHHDRGDPGALGCSTEADLAPASDVQLIASDGTITACLTSEVGALPVPRDADLGYRTIRQGGTSFRVLVATTRSGKVQVARSLSEDDAVLDRLRLWLAVMVGGGIALAVGAGWLLARGIAGPIVRLRDTAETIARTGDLETPIPAKGRGEVGSLGRSFTTMVSGLATSKAQQRRLVDDASHEMRTPLTSLTSNLEYLEHFDRLPADERAEVLDAVQVDVHELTELLAELVELATDRADEDEPEQFALVDVARDVAQRTARRSGRSITVEAGDDAGALVTATPHQVERAISNLLDNAIKYSPAPGAIEVVVAGGRIDVRDHGPGIAAADQPQVFDRFFRATEARTAPGSGLGLSIVRDVVERNHGTVWARNRADGPGAEVGFELPASP